MESVTVKFNEDVLARVDKSIAKHNFNSRTEFLREAVRDKLDELSREELVNKFLSFRGTADKKTTLQQNKITREKVGKALMKDLEKRFS